MIYLFKRLINLSSQRTAYGYFPREYEDKSTRKIREIKCSMLSLLLLLPDTEAQPQPVAPA